MKTNNTLPIAVAEVRFIPRTQNFGVYFGIPEDKADREYYGKLKRIIRVLSETPEGDKARFATSKEAEEYVGEILSRIHASYNIEQDDLKTIKELASSQPYKVQHYSLSVESDGEKVISKY